MLALPALGSSRGIDPASCSHAALLSFPWSPGSPWAGIWVFFLIASLGQMRHLYPWEQAGPDAPSVHHFMLLLRAPWYPR